MWEEGRKREVGGGVVEDGRVPHPKNDEKVTIQVYDLLLIMRIDVFKIKFHN